MRKFLFLFFLLTAAVSFGQTVKLEVLMNDKKIGDITAGKTVKGKSVHATLTSKVNVTMLFQVNVESTITSDYKDGKLIKSDAARVSNIKSENKKSAVVLAGNQYTITKDDGTQTTQTGPAKYGVLDLYFTEPKSITQAFSELGGIYMPVTFLQDHRYELKISDSKKDVFVYDEKGKLVQVETVIAMNKVVFKVVKE